MFEITTILQLPVIRNCLAVISDIIFFINGSVYRKDVFAKICGDAQKKSLTKFCETRYNLYYPNDRLNPFSLFEFRWVERHTSIVAFVDLFENVLDCLGTITTLKDVNAASKATCFLNALQSSENLIALCVLIKLFSLTSSLAT